MIRGSRSLPISRHAHRRHRTRPAIVFAVTVPLTVRFLRGQLAWTSRFGFDVTLVTAPGPGLSDVALQEGVVIITIPMEREIHVIRDLISLYRILRLLHRLRPDITHVSNPKAGLIGGIAAALTGVPARVYTLRGLRLETTRGLRRRILWLAEWTACRSAHAVVAVSPSLAERAVALGVVSRSKIQVIGSGSSNGVDAAHFRPTPARRHRALALRTHLGIPLTAPVIGFVGRQLRDKGFPELLAAFRMVQERLPGAWLLLIGRPEPAGWRPGELETLLSRVRQVAQAGHLADPADAYLAMDVLALPTHREGLPNVALEAAASALPVVATAATGAIDAVRDGETGFLVPPHDVNALAAALLTVLTDPQRARHLGGSGRRWVEEAFAQERVWEGLGELYTQLLASSRAQLPSAAAEQPLPHDV